MAKRPSRAQLKQRLLDEAASVLLPDACDVAVIGGGAAGLVAAICAAEAGASVVVLERNLACGRPILATGNGRCNFANVRLDPKRYNDPSFVQATCGKTWLDDVLRFFRASGLRWCLEEDRLYPMSRQAASVRNVLLARARRAGVILAPAREVTDVRRPGAPGQDLHDAQPRVKGSVSDDAPVELVVAERFSAADGLRQLRARTLVVATGKEPLPALEGLGLKVAAPRPVLCPLACAESPLFALDGRRAHVCAYLTKAGALFPSWHERGELLFRNYGVSGIVSFDLSRRAEPGDLLELDLAPDLSASELRQLVDPLACGGFEPGCLDGVLDPEVAQLLEELAHRRWRVPWPERREPANESEALLSLAKALPLVVSGPAEAASAQVSRGGLLTSQFDAETLTCHAFSWLFAAGEALDIDADCGGFNLAWAWKSGMVAGAAAARRAAGEKGAA